MTKKELKDKTRAAWENTPHGTFGLFDLLDAIIDALPENVGQHSTGTAAPSAEAQQSKDTIWHNPETGDVHEWVSVERIKTEEDARKLRIMKAMEERLDVDPDARFKRIGGTWGWIGDDGLLITLPPTAEPAPTPLWEREVLVHENGGMTNPLGGNGDEDMINKYGWRRIKVREVRE